MLATWPTYGRLYNWYAATNARGAVPKWLACSYGWRVDGIGGLHHSQGFNGTEGTALKSTSGWSSGGNGTDDFGFSALPGGYRYARMATSTLPGLRLLVEFFAQWRQCLVPDLDTTIQHRPELHIHDGFSVRCLRDAD